MDSHQAETHAVTLSEKGCETEPWPKDHASSAETNSINGESDDRILMSYNEMAAAQSIEKHCSKRKE